MLASYTVCKPAFNNQLTRKQLLKNNSSCKNHFIMYRGKSRQDNAVYSIPQIPVIRGSLIFTHATRKSIPNLQRQIKEVKC